MSVIGRRFLAQGLRRRPLFVVPRSRAYASDADEEPDYDLDNYPKVPDVSRQYQSATGWQDMLLRRNIGDPVRDFEPKSVLYALNTVAS